MKKILLPLALTIPLAGAADSARQTLHDFMQAALGSDAGKAAQLIYLSPELLAHNREAALRPVIRQCLEEKQRHGKETLDSVRETANDGQRAVLRVTLKRNGKTEESPPVVALKTADGWRIDFLDYLLAYGCGHLDIGSPLPAAQAVVDAYAAKDAEKLARLVYVSPENLDVPVDDPALRQKIVAQMREEIASAAAENLSVKLDPDNPPQSTDEQCADVPAIAHQGGETYESALPMCKSARGWQINGLFESD